MSHQLNIDRTRCIQCSHQKWSCKCTLTEEEYLEQMIKSQSKLKMPGRTPMPDKQQDKKPMAARNVRKPFRTTKDGNH